MKNIFFGLLAVMLVGACDFNKQEYIMGQTAFCDDRNFPEIICTDKDNNPITGKVVVLDGNNMRSEMLVKNGHLNGAVKGYHPNGKLAIMGNFQNGPHGSVREYYENGIIRSEGHIKNGKEEGLVKEYYEDGTLKSESVYENGDKNGAFKTYYLNGKLESQGVYKNGKKDGLIKEYYVDGVSLKSEIVYDNGMENGEYKIYRLGGSIELEGFYKDGKKHGTENVYDIRENLVNLRIYKDGEAVSIEIVEVK